MSIKKNLEDLPYVRPRGAHAPLAETMVMNQLADAWWAEYQAGENFTRDRAIPELPLRASDISTRCDRALFYKLVEAVKTNPSDAASVWRMRLGQLIHTEVETSMSKIFPSLHDAEGRKHGWWAEETVDLQPAGFPGSAHGDNVYYIHGEPKIVMELKSQGGFAFKMMTTTFKGEPDGPRWDHKMQAAMVAVALGAPQFMVCYIAMESTSPDLAAKMGMTAAGRFTAEWIYETADWREAVAAEAARQRRVLELARSFITPERTLQDEDHGVVLIDNPKRGNWNRLDRNGNIDKSGTTWQCGYCDFRDRCIDDGENSFKIGDEDAPEIEWPT